MNTYTLQPHQEFTFIWRIFVMGRETSAFIPALECPAPAGASQDDLARLDEWINQTF